MSRARKLQLRENARESYVIARSAIACNRRVINAGVTARQCEPIRSMREIRWWQHTPFADGCDIGKNNASKYTVTVSRSGAR